MRGTIVEWLEWLSYGVESHRKVVSLRLGFTSRQLENFFVTPVVNGYFFQILEG